MSNYNIKKNKDLFTTDTAPVADVSPDVILDLEEELAKDGELTHALVRPEVFDYELAGRYSIVGDIKAATAPKVGFEQLDKLFSFVGGRLTVLSAQTHVGKTTLASNIAANVAARQNRKVLMFVPESGIETAVKHISCYLNNKTEAELTVEEIRTRIPMLKLVEKSVSINDIERIALVEKPELLIVDHLHYLLKSEQNVTQSIGQAIRGLCELSKKLNIHILVICHLKKPNAGEENKIPTIYSLKDSSALYQDPDVVLLIHRKRRPVELSQPGEDRLESDGLIIVEKNRINGKSGIVRFFFDKERHTFLI